MLKRMIKNLDLKLRRSFDKQASGANSPPLRDSLKMPDDLCRADKGRPIPEGESAANRREWTVEDFHVEAKDGFDRFHDYDLPSPIMRAVHELGFDYCTPIQSKVFALTRGGGNIAGRAQTGTGKTAAFLICILTGFLEKGYDKKTRAPGNPRALILAPTRELVLQIAKDAEALGKYTPFKCLAVYGGMDLDAQRRRLSERPWDLVAATPGRLLDFLGRRAINLRGVEVLIIDEADRMLDMGFIPDVRRIIRATPRNEKRQTMLFSATLTKDVLRLASQWMPDPIICEVEPEHVAVQTVRQMVYIVRTSDKFNLICNLLAGDDMKRVLVFGNRRDTTQRLADNLRRHGIECEYLSGSVRQEKRLKVLDAFRRGEIRIVVATDVAGRGLHVDDISHVINYDFPYEPEDYVHRIGRTGRAGEAGVSISFACEAESFVIPEIEEYIGTPLKCVMPEPELLKPVAPSKESANRPARSGSDRARSGKPSRRSRRGVMRKKEPFRGRRA